MNKYKKFIPIVAVVLIALGVNLERFGIDLEALSGGGSQQQTTNTGASNNSSGGSSNHAGTRSIAVANRLAIIHDRMARMHPTLASSR